MTASRVFFSTERLFELIQVNEPPPKIKKDRCHAYNPSRSLVHQPHRGLHRNQASSYWSRGLFSRKCVRHVFFRVESEPRLAWKAQTMQKRNCDSLTKQRRFRYVSVSAADLRRSTIKNLVTYLVNHAF